MENKYISIKVIIDRIMTRPLYKGLQFDTAILWAVESLNLIDTPDFLVEKIAKIFVEEYKGTLPYDCVAVNKINVINHEGETRRMAMKTSSDPFLKNYKNRINIQKEGVFSDYRIEGDYVHTGLETGWLEISYRALPLDADNYIMIPDNAYVILAVENYIKFQHVSILWENGEVSRDFVEKQEQAYCWSVGQAQSQRGLENLDKIESIRNSLGRLVPIADNHYTDYRFGTLRENRKI